MFDGSKEIAPRVYLYENFLDADENEFIFNLIQSESESLWKKHGNGENSIYILNTESVKGLMDKVKEICPKGLDTIYNQSANRVAEGIVYGEHVDINTSQHILEASKKYIEGEEFVTGDYPRFGLVYYFNDNYDQGEIYYPELGLTHKPKSGDLVIHAADILHGTKPPSNGTRYTYTTAYTEKLKMSVNVI